MTEDQLIQLLKEAEQEYQNAKRVLTIAKDAWTDAETDMVSAKIALERAQNALREHRDTVPSTHPEIELRDQEIEKFRQDHSDLVQWAKERDLNR